MNMLTIMNPEVCHTAESAGGELATLCQQSMGWGSHVMCGESWLTVRMSNKGLHGKIGGVCVQCTPDGLGRRSIKGCMGREPTSSVVAVRAVHYYPLVAVGFNRGKVAQLPDKLIDSLRLRCLHDTGTLEEAQTSRGRHDASSQLSCSV